jgi:hypothetical protein
LATGLSTAITKDGQTATTARIPFAAGINSSLATDSSSTSTGSIITAGGIGVAKALYVGTTANVAGAATLSSTLTYGGVTLTNAVTGTGKMVLDTSPTLVTPALGTPASGVLTNCTGVQYTGFKNRIINGAMVIDQRNAGASVTPTTNFTYTVDRWVAGLIQSSKFSVQQNAGSVTPPAGFTNYLGITSLSAYSVTSTDYFNINQFIEGFNWADLGFGTANAQTVTLSFWVRSSLTGTFGGVLANSAGSRAYPFTYTISSANTWEQKTVTIAGDTTGTWVGATNGIGARLWISLGTGSSFATTAGAWAAGNYVAPTGATSVVGTNGATFYITGVQLEKGSTATSFDYRPYGTELALCQRYFEKSVNQGTSITKNAETSFFATVSSTTVANSVTYVTQRYVVTKRTAPTVLVYPYTTATNTARISNDGGTDLAANSAFVNAVSDSFFSVSNTSGGTITTGAQLIFIGNWYASAEL